MRHFRRRILGPAFSLPRCVLACAATRTLILRAGAQERLAPADRAAVACTVNLAVIAGRADTNDPLASRAAKDPKAPIVSGTTINLPAHGGDRILLRPTVATIRRNDPCPCGSRKKYKRCCLQTQVPDLRKTSAVITALDPIEDDDLCECCIDELNQRADHALDLLLEGHFDAAEALSHELMHDFPGEVEGVDLLAMIAEARGQPQRAVQLLRQAIDIANAHPHLDVETRVLMHERLRELELGR